MKNKGFSLVELIVVIAIMAILVGVAVPVYSSYIEKSQKAKDEQMIDEIKHAIEIAGAAATFAEGESGYIVLSTTGVSKVEGENLKKVLAETFGANYMNDLKLSYGDWASNGLYNNLTPESAYAVKNSSYLTGLRADDLLADVEIMTGMAQNLVTVLGSGSGMTEGMTLSGMFTKDDGTCVLDATAAKYGVTKEEGQTWEQWAAQSPANNAAYSNLLVLAAADESEQFMSTMGQDDQYQMSGASNMILEFSSFYAYAAVTPEFSATLDTYMAHLNGDTTIPGLAPVTDASTGAAWYNQLKAAAGDGYTAYEATLNGGQAFVDQAGFLSIMAGIGNPSKEQAGSIGADLSNSNLFTDGIVNDMYNDYLDGVNALGGFYDPAYDGYGEWDLGLEDGNVAIMFAVRDGALVILSSLPNA